MFLDLSEQVRLHSAHKPGGWYSSKSTGQTISYHPWTQEHVLPTGAPSLKACSFLSIKKVYALDKSMMKPRYKNMPFQLVLLKNWKQTNFFNWNISQTWVMIIERNGWPSHAIIQGYFFCKSKKKNTKCSRFSEKIIESSCTIWYQIMLNSIRWTNMPT